MTAKRAKTKPDLRPPWTVFSEGGKPVSIMPAGRPGDVADVRGVPAHTVRRIVTAANSGDDFVGSKLNKLYEKTLELTNATNAALIRRVSELESLRIPCDICGGEWCGRCTKAPNSAKRGISMTVKEFAERKRVKP